MSLNPYAKFLGEQDARAVIAATPGLLHQAVCALTPEQIEAPIAPGKWSVREIVAHMADCELVFGFRLRQTLAMNSPVIQPFDQDDCATRAWNLKLIGGASEADFARETTHPERGAMTFGTVVETMAGHDLNHLAQVQKAGHGV
jgi:hypothetical protein